MFKIVSSESHSRHRWFRRLTVVGLAAAAASVALASPASAAWKNCGDYICTKYYTKAETQQLNRDFQDADAATGGVVGLICNYLPITENCGFGSNGYYNQLKESTALAAALDGCLKVESSADPDQTWVRAGVTTNPDWCLTRDPSNNVPDQAYWG